MSEIERARQTRKMFCVCVCPVEISFYVRLHQPGIVPAKCLVFNMWMSLKMHKSKVIPFTAILGHPCGGGEHQQIDLT